VNTAASAIVGLVVGLLLTVAVAQVTKLREAKRHPEKARPT
jgi:hypothetical protein